MGLAFDIWAGWVSIGVQGEQGCAWENQNQGCAWCSVSALAAGFEMLGSGGRTVLLMSIIRVCSRHWEVSWCSCANGGMCGGAPVYPSRENKCLDVAAGQATHIRVLWLGACWHC